MGKEIKEKCKECVYYNEKMEYPMVDGQTTNLNCMSIKCDYRKVTKDLKIVRLKNKIADLEAKLSESEKKYNDTKELGIEQFHSLKEIINSSQEEIDSLNLELAQKNELFIITKWKADDLEKQLAEEKNLNKKLNHEAQKYYEDAYCNGFQNQTAIAELEKVKDFIVKSDIPTERKTLTVRFINQQIKSLKGDADGKDNSL